MRTLEERIFALEAGQKRLRDGQTATAVAITTALQTALDQMVDDRKITAAARREIWLRFERGAAEIAALSPAVAEALRRAIPQGAMGAVIPSDPQPRQKRELLRGPSQRRDADQ